MLSENQLRVHDTTNITLAAFQSGVSVFNLPINILNVDTFYLILVAYVEGGVDPAVVVKHLAVHTGGGL